MDPDFFWYLRNFIDAGEYSVDGLAKPLIRGVDRPDHTHYIDALVAGDNGRPSLVSDLIGIFERENGDPSWRHQATPGEGGPEGRRKRDLVVRSAATIGNYDYIVDWIFQQDGSIEVRLGATGIVEAKVVHESGVGNLSRSEGGNRPDAHGRFVDARIVAVNHDHYFSFRLDLDVDGETNNMQFDKIVPGKLPADHPRKVVWVVESQVAKRETEAKKNISMKRPALWRVTSDQKKNHVGYPTSYQLAPGMNGETLMHDHDYAKRRAGFLRHHLWVTPYHRDERYAAGNHPPLSEPGQGLPEWTAANRSIEKTDIVLWYTMVMHHLVRGEEWPVMPVVWHSFKLRPFDFFDRNPALDLPE